MKAVLRSVSAAWRKAEREAYRALHAKSKAHQSDHFFNFCVAAHSLRDHFFEQRGLHDPADRDPYHNLWNADPQLVAVAEIANLTKHFRLRNMRTRQPRTPQTRRLAQKRGTALDVYITPPGAITTIPRASHDLVVTTSDRQRYQVWEFQVDVLESWRAFLRAEGIRVYHQSLKHLIDQGPGAQCR